MSITELQKRFSGLYKLREKLCQKEKNWDEAFQARDWILFQLKDLKSIASDDTKDKNDVIDRIDDIICVLEPEEEDDE
tara:strand:- start:645 stop:878 length:234 start_codon:yes stop_codon:yes gene_type:complete